MRSSNPWAFNAVTNGRKSAGRALRGRGSSSPAARSIVANTTVTMARARADKHG